MKWLKQFLGIIGKRDKLEKFLKEIEIYTEQEGLVEQLPENDNDLKFHTVFNILYEANFICTIDWQGMASDYIHELKKLHILQFGDVDFAGLEDEFNRMKKQDVVRFIRKTDRFVKDFKFLIINTKSDSYGVVAIPKGKTSSFRYMAKATRLFKATQPKDEPVIQK